MDQNLSMTRGDTGSFNLQFVNYDGDLENDMQSMIFTVKENVDSGVAVLQKTLGSGISKVNDGLYVVRIAPADTEDLALGYYYYDLQIGINGDVFTVLKGVIEITYDVTTTEQTVIIAPYEELEDIRVGYDGTLYNAAGEAVRSQVRDLHDEVDVLDGRMDEFASLPEGSTAGNAELVDIRVGANGVTYPTAGDAVRGQVEELDDKIDNNTDAIGDIDSDVNVLKSRIDVFTSLEEGSTTGDAELQDIRVGYDGTTYPSAGDAVRGQAEDLDKGLNLLADSFTLTNLYNLSDFVMGGYYGSNGAITSNENSAYTEKYVPVNSNDTYYYYGREGQLQVLTYNAQHEFIERAINSTSLSGSFTVDDDVAYIRISIYSVRTNLPYFILNNYGADAGSDPTQKYFLNPIGAESIKDNVIGRSKMQDGVLATNASYLELRLSNPSVVSLGDGYINWNGAIVTVVGYKSFYYKINSDCDCYFIPNNLHYYSINVYSDLPIGSTTAISDRYRYSYGGEDTAPRIDSKLHLSAGNYIALSFQSDEIGDGSYLYLNDSTLGVVLNDNVLFNSIQIEKIKDISNKQCKMQYYGSENDDGVLIYLPEKVGYLKFDFDHVYNTSTNANSWRINPTYAVDDEFHNRFECTVGGEWECAVRLAGRPDFSGGMAHGDEKYTYLLFLVDGTPYTYVELADKGILTFETLKIIEISDLYDPSDNVTKIAEHDREYTFTKKGVNIRQKLTWKITDTLDACYLAMFPIGKSVSDMCYFDTMYEPKEVSTVYGNNDGVKKVTTYSDDLGFMGSFAITKYPTGYTGSDILNIRDNGGGDYNKMYYNICTSGSIHSGDVWDSETIYEFYVGEPVEE